MNVKIIRFKKDSGKFYDEVEVKLPKYVDTSSLDPIWEYIKRVRDESKRDYLIYLVDVPEHPFNHPKLII